MSQFNFFDVEQQLAKIHALNGFLPKLSQLIDFELFRPLLEEARPAKEQPKGGRPPYDNVLLFKILVLKHLYNLSDENTEAPIRDRLSFMHFLGLTIADRFPDARTLWLFGEQLKEHNIERKVFDLFNELLTTQGFAAQGGSIVDGTFIEVPRQRNTREENAQIKKGEVPESFQGDANKHKLAHKDLDARWTQKNDVNYFGYKDHVKTDVKYKLIRDYTVTDASVHDSNEFLDFFPAKSEEEQMKPWQAEDFVFSDSAYVHHTEELRERGYLPRICEKGYRNKPLTEEQKAGNREKSKVRCRVEHIFGMMKMRMGNEIMRCIGKARAVFQIGMRNFVYNVCRYVSLVEKG